MWGAGAPPAPAPTSTAYGQAHPHPHPHGAAMDPMAQFGQMANLVSNPMFSSMAANVADWDNRKQQVEQNVSRLKYYFNVNNSYVLNKLKLLAFPWLHKHWQRRQAGDGSGPGQYLPPREDVNAPDLYIPSMAFVTFILTAGLFYGYQEEFSPEKLGIVASSTLAWLVLEVGLIVLGLYLLNVATDYSFIDIVCYCGYKYLSMIAAMLAFIFTDSDMTAYYVVLAYMSCAVGFFLVCPALRYPLFYSCTTAGLGWAGLGWVPHDMGLVALFPRSCGRCGL
jgi:hypothetical protein